MVFWVNHPIIGSYMPDAANYTIENYAPLTPVWTWKVPERYVVHEKPTLKPKPALSRALS